MTKLLVKRERISLDITGMLNDHFYKLGCKSWKTKVGMDIKSLETICCEMCHYLNHAGTKVRKVDGYHYTVCCRINRVCFKLYAEYSKCEWCIKLNHKCLWHDHNV